MDKLFTAGIVGAGNLAFNLAANLKVRGHSLKIVLSRTQESAENLVTHWRGVPAGNMDLALPESLDLLFLTVPDHDIESVAGQLADRVGPNTCVVHCSGSIDIAALDAFGERAGVMWPIQTLTKDHVANFDSIPMVIETRTASADRLRAVANSMSNRVSEMNSLDRCKAHLGAVFASNFANFMWSVSGELLADPEGPGFEIYAPLIQEQVKKAIRYAPKNVQTGPARRGDEVTLQKHLELLADDPELQEVYRRISAEIEKRY